MQEAQEKDLDFLLGSAGHAGDICQWHCHSRVGESPSTSAGGWIPALAGTT